MIMPGEHGGWSELYTLLLEHKPTRPLEGPGILVHYAVWSLVDRVLQYIAWRWEAMGIDSDFNLFIAYQRKSMIPRFAYYSTCHTVFLSTARRYTVSFSYVARQVIRPVAQSARHESIRCPFNCTSTMMAKQLYGTIREVDMKTGTGSGRMSAELSIAVGLSCTAKKFWRYLTVRCITSGICRRSC